MDIRAAKRMYEASRQVDRELYQEHFRLLNLAILKAINARERQIMYTVPARVYGTFPVYDDLTRKEITLFLLKELKQLGYTTRLHSVADCEIVISGWHGELQIDREKPTELKQFDEKQRALRQLMYKRRGEYDNQGEINDVCLEMEEERSDGDKDTIFIPLKQHVERLAAKYK